MHNIYRDQLQTYFLERLQQVGARHRDNDVQLVHDEQWLILLLVREIRQIVGDVNQLIQRSFLHADHRTTSGPIQIVIKHAVFTINSV